MTEDEVYNVNATSLSGVNGELAKACLYIINAVKNDGYLLIVAEGYRTPEQQDIYYAQGRTTPGPIITQLRGNQGKHTKGQAVDFDFVINGEQSNANGNPWNIIGRHAHEVGLSWGGDWSSLKDYRHVEMPTSAYTAPSFANNSLPESDYVPNSDSGGGLNIALVVGVLLAVWLLTE